MTNWKDKFIISYAYNNCKEPWQMTREEMRNSCLFHGTREPFNGPWRGGGYDSVAWSAENPAVAQTYISNYSQVMIPKPYESSLKDSIVPQNHDKFTNQLLKQLGFKPIIHEQKDGFTTSFSYEGGVFAKKKDMVEFLESMGYPYKSDSPFYKILVDEEDNVLPASSIAQGEMLIIMGKENLKLYDMYDSNSENLMEPDYHKVGLFKKLEKLGYDGVRINDFAQSENWGNIGHSSVGLFPSGLNKIRYERIKAKRFDFGDRLDEYDTDDFIEWHKQQVTDAINNGLDVPKNVRDEYGL